MNTEALKPRAKRLRAAVAEMFKVTVSNSQSLELVAKEENYPNWDAACAAERRTLPNSASASAVQSSILVRVLLDQKPSVASIFGQNEAVHLEMNRLLDLTDSRGALVLISGTSLQGKTTTVHVVMSELALDMRPANERQLSGVGSRKDGFSLSNRLKLIDEVRDEAGAFEAVALALAGVKVVATIHATKGIERLRTLLRYHGAGETLLDRLLVDAQVISVQQELEWADTALRQDLLQARHAEADAAVRAATRHDSEPVFTPVT